MDNITSGITTVQNIDKFWDYAIPVILFMLAGVLHQVFQNRKTPHPDLESRLLNGLPLGFTSAYIAYVVGACFDIPETALSIATLCLAGIMTYALAKEKLELPSALPLCIALCALNLKIVTTQGTWPILVLLNAAALMLVLKQKTEFLIAIVSLIVFKKFDFGPYIVNDLFHSSEFMISYQRGLNSLGEWQVFPNIGYLEEAIPNFIVDAFYKVSLGNLQISIQDAYSLCLIFLTAGMYYFLEKKWKGVAYALTMLFAVERLTLLVVINLGLLLTARKSNYLTWAAIGLTPLLMLGLSPSYGAILLLSLALYFLKNKPKYNLLVPTVLIACACLVGFGDSFVYFLKVYKDWGAVNSAAHGTAMWAAPLFKTVLRLAFVLSFSFFVWQAIEGEKFDSYSILALIGISISLWMYLNYGFTRLDKDTGSRIFPVGLAIFAIVMPYLQRYTKAVPALLFISFFGASFATPQPIGQIQLSRQSPKMTLDAESQEILDRYTSVVQKLGSEVILFGGQPTLGNFIPNVLIPPFSSPWVAIGQLPQERVIAFLQTHSKLPVILGDNFLTWDHVDVRARSPLIYRYMAEHYKLTVIQDVIVAIPSAEQKQSTLFSDFNIGAASSYYQKSKDQVVLTIPCAAGESVTSEYKVINEHNYFYARLRCGENAVPQVYFLGAPVSVSTKQVP